MDFSQFATITPEWREYVRSHPQPASVSPSISPNDKEYLTELRNAANTDRCKWSAQKLIEHDLLGKFITLDHRVTTRDGNTIPLRCYYHRSKFESSSDENVKSAIGAPCPAFIHLHGGGFLNGSLDTETYICAAIAVKLGIVVVHPEYRHTNEVSFPVPHEDVWDAFQWINANCSEICIDPANMVVGGQSAGSGLAASLVQREVIEAHRQGRSSRIKGQVLTIPWLAHPRAFEESGFLDESAMSTTQCANAAGLSTEKLEWFASLLRAEDLFSELLNPGLIRPIDAHGIPRAAFLVAGGDPSRDQGLLYARHLEDAGIPTKVCVFSAMPHTFRGMDGLKSAEGFMLKLFEAVAWALDASDDSQGTTEWTIE